MDIARGHIDDMIFVSSNSGRLSKAMTDVTERMDQAGWPLNNEKSVLDPVKEVEFLRAILSSDYTVNRTAAASRLTSSLIGMMAREAPTGKDLEKVRGILNY